MKNKPRFDVHSLKTKTLIANHTIVQSEKRFAEVIKSFEQQLGKFDPNVFESHFTDPQNDKRAQPEPRK